MKHLLFPRDVQLDSSTGLPKPGRRASRDQNGKEGSGREEEGRRKDRHRKALHRHEEVSRDHSAPEPA